MRGLEKKSKEAGLGSKCTTTLLRYNITLYAVFFLPYGAFFTQQTRGRNTVSKRKSHKSAEIKQIRLPQYNDFPHVS